MFSVPNALALFVSVHKSSNLVEIRREKNFSRNADISALAIYGWGLVDLAVDPLRSEIDHFHLLLPHALAVQQFSELFAGPLEPQIQNKEPAGLVPAFLLAAHPPD